MNLDPISQFEIKTIVQLQLFGVQADLTNAAIFKIIAALAIVLFIWGSLRGRYDVPDRMQTLMEMGYEFVEDLLRSTAGPESTKFFPLIFSLFCYILIANLLGMIPGAYTFTSQVVVTGAMALVCMVLITIYGFLRNGLGFFKLFAPSGVGPVMLLLLVPLEIISYLVRPFSLALRLAINMIAGHMIVKIFAAFVVGLVASGFFPYMLVGVASFVILIGITALELLVAFLQAYVFAVLVSVYLHDAIHPSH